MITLQCPKCMNHWRIEREEAQRDIHTICPHCNTVWHIRKKRPKPGPVIVANPPGPFTDFLIAELKTAGFEVLHTPSGKELKELITKKPSCIFANVVLEEELGIQVCEWMKNQKELQHIPFVIIGSLFRVERYRRPATRLYGADDYVEEGISSEELRGLVRRLTGWTHIPAEARSPLEEKLRRQVRLMLTAEGKKPPSHAPMTKEEVRHKIQTLFPAADEEMVMRVLSDYFIQGGEYRGG